MHKISPSLFNSKIFAIVSYVSVWKYRRNLITETTLLWVSLQVKSHLDLDENKQI